MYLEIFLIGLLGSAHCIGMCGGFVAMYSLKKPAARPSLAYHLLYNLGRIITYSLLGGMLGSIGSFFAYVGRHRGIPGAVLLIAGMIMVLMGLNIAGVLGKRGFFEESGIIETSFFRKTLRRILNLDSVWATFLFGLLLGLLPCGLLYPIFMYAAAGGSLFSGAMTMAVFGLGTAPAMLLFGFLVTKIQPSLKRALYRLAAALIILLGVKTLLRGLSFNGWISHTRFW